MRGGTVEAPSVHYQPSLNSQHGTRNVISISLCLQIQPEDHGSLEHQEDLSLQGAPASSVGPTVSCRLCRHPCFLGKI